MIGSQHDGYHVGSMLQGFAHCGKFGGTWVCNLVGILNMMSKFSFLFQWCVLVN